MSILMDGAALPLISPEVSSHTVMVNPVIARGWLETQIRNRPIQDRAMDSYRADMIAGRWGFDGAPIRFDKEGHLLDGQNRLTALAGIKDESFELPFVVVRGLDPETQMVMDQGARRTAGQQLGLKGLGSGSSMAAGARVAMWWELDALFSRWEGENLVTNTAVVAWIQARPELTKHVAAQLHKVRNIQMRPSAGLGFAFRLGLGLRDEVSSFFDEMNDLSDLPAGSPTLTLAKRLARVRGDVDLRLSETDQLGFLVHTWNNWAANKSASRLQRPKGGWTAENFPRVDGI